MNKRVILFLPAVMLAGGFLSVLFGKELCWDLANYHFYNPFAFLYDRDQYDFWPSSFIHQYINPTLDFISYFLITQVSPWSAEFILGAIHAINAWILFLIAKEFIQERQHEWIAIFLALFGMCGPTVLPGIGSFTNDNFISLFVLGFVLLQIKSLRAETQRQFKLSNKFQIASGVLLGIGFGLKLTAGIFIAGAILTTLILPVSYTQRLRMLFCWGGAAGVGFFLTSGYWMHLQWIKHHNPLFPFFNGFLHSDEFTYANWRDSRFLPHGMLQHLFYPFYFSLNGKMTADTAYTDCRILMAFILFLIAGCQWSWKRSTDQFIDHGRYWLFAFVIFSYGMWQEYFSIARYFAPVEMLAPLVIYLLVQQICVETTRRAILLTVIFCTIAFAFSPIETPRARWYSHSFFNINIPTSVNASRAHVLMTYPAFIVDQKRESVSKASAVDYRNPVPQSYLIPFFPRSWHFTGIPIANGKYLEDARTSQMIKERLRNLSGTIYLLSSDYSMPELYRIAARFSLQPNGRCNVITSDRQAMTHQQVLLCPVHRSN